MSLLFSTFSKIMKYEIAARRKNFVQSSWFYFCAEQKWFSCLEFERGIIAFCEYEQFFLVLVQSSRAVNDVKLWHIVTIFFISLGVSPSTANVSAVQKKQRIQVNLGHHVRLNCHHHPTFDKWRPHTKWKKNVKWFKNGRRLRPKTLPKNISIKNKR